MTIPPDLQNHFIGIAVASFLLIILPCLWVLFSSYVYSHFVGRRPLTAPFARPRQRTLTREQWDNFGAKYLSCRYFRIAPDECIYEIRRTLPLIGPVCVQDNCPMRNCTSR